MKFHGSFEVGSLHEVIIKDIRWLREQHNGGKYTWRKEHTTRHKPDEWMIRRIQQYLDDPIYRVEFNIHSCNIRKIPQEVDLVAMTMQPHKDGKSAFLTNTEVLERGITIARRNLR